MSAGNRKEDASDWRDSKLSLNGGSVCFPKCNYVFRFVSCGINLTSLLNVTSTNSKMATLVLDNGAYTAKIGYSLEKVR